METGFRTEKHTNNHLKTCLCLSLTENYTPFPANGINPRLTTRYITVVKKNEEDATPIIDKQQTQTVEENLLTGKTSTSFPLENIQTIPKGQYLIKVYMDLTSEKPVSTGVINITDKPFTMLTYLQDHLGSTRMITDEEAKIISTHNYQPFGNEVTQANYETNTHKFTTHERDAETGLDYAMARMLSGDRFLQVDPGYDYDQMDPMSWNLYGYVRGNPIRFIDLSGLSAKEAQQIINSVMGDSQIFLLGPTHKDMKERSANIYKDKIFKMDTNNIEIGNNRSVNPDPSKTEGAIAWWHSHPINNDNGASYESPLSIADVLKTVVTNNESSGNVKYSFAENSKSVYAVEITQQMQITQDDVNSLRKALIKAVKLENGSSFNKGKRGLVMEKALKRVLKKGTFRGKVIIYKYNKKNETISVFYQ